MINLQLSKQLSYQYKTANPFPYIVIDEFLPEIILNSVLDEFNKNKNWWYDRVKWTEPYQVNKFYWPHDIETANNMPNDLPIISVLVNYLNSPEMLKYLEELTGISNLVGDELLMGGGLHKITSGGKLAVHKDYNVHPIKKMYRRLNLLIYLNRDWKKEWGGNLELWDKDYTRPQVSVEPLFNRAVIFTISENSLHGHPTPLNTPENVSRNSIALYYFTEVNPDVNNEHGVVFYDSKN
jgi:Rps23 Pro-64 3,4-dihydroxylase Tpa1-like proline 4-hydroxylase